LFCGVPLDTRKHCDLNQLEKALAASSVWILDCVEHLAFRIPATWPLNAAQENRICPFMTARTGVFGHVYRSPYVRYFLDTPSGYLPPHHPLPIPLP
jgi:hypothetical protein